MAGEMVARERPWRSSGKLALMIAGTALGIFGVVRRLRNRRRPKRVDVGSVSDEWLAEHRASRE